MKRVYVHVIIFCVLAIIGCFSSEVMAIDAYFDSEISTDLEYTPNTGTLVVRMLDEEVPPILPDVVYQRTIYVLIIFDASKTMGEPDVNGIPKIHIARKLVSILVNHFPQRDTQFALRVNGAKYPNNCLDSELMVPFSSSNGQLVVDTVSRFQPTGLSPLTYSLRQVLDDFHGTTGAKIVFMITDGLETCDIEPADTCTMTMDLLRDAEFDGNINVLGVNTIYSDAQTLLSCLSARGYGDFLDSNRNSGRQFARLIQESSQMTYSVSRILDPDTLSEGIILGLLNRRVGDATELAETSDTRGAGTDVLVKPGIIEKSTSGFEVKEVDVVDLPKAERADSLHELPPGVYKIEFITTPPLASYFTIDQGQEFVVGIVRSGDGFDFYDRAHLSIGNSYYDKGQYEKALAEYQKVVDFDPRNVDAHLNMGIIYQDILPDNEKATFHYKNYLELQGPRQEEVSQWFRQAQGLPSEEEELQRKLQDREKERAEEEAKLLKKEQDALLEKESKKAEDAYNEILTANPNIKELSEEAVLSGAPILEAFVSDTTSDSRAEKVALDIGKRMHSLLNQHPEILIYRENDRDTLIKQALYDEDTQQYVIVE